MGAEVNEPPRDGCTVVVPIDEWRTFYHHAPEWWPVSFADPTPELMARVERRLRERAAA